MIGKTLAHYEVTGNLGKGGMGEVYQAKDQKLGRDVAIKVLPEEFASDADRVARFQREAKLLASLNHPNIAAIHGLEESDGMHFLVLEMVGGETLSELIKRGPIPVEESLKLAMQAADALEAAHEKGVIHRDLKPANIKITPDGKWIAYFSDSDNSLKKISASGGTPIKLCSASYFVGGDWGSDDRIVYSDYSQGIMQVSANGGDPEVLVKRDKEHFVYPQILPDGKSLLFTLGNKPIIAVHSLESGERKELDVGGYGGQYIPTGHIVYALDNSLFAVSFDMDTLAVTKGPVSLVEGVVMPGVVPQCAISQSGLLSYIPGYLSDQSQLEWYDRQGNLIASVGEPAAYDQLALSPDEKRAVVEISSTGGYDLWIVDLERQGVRRRLTFDTANERDPVWSPDGKSVLFNSDKNGLDDLYLKSLAGEEEPELLYHSERRLVAEDWSDREKE